MVKEFAWRVERREPGSQVHTLSCSSLIAPPSLHVPEGWPRPRVRQCRNWDQSTDLLPSGPSPDDLLLSRTSPGLEGERGKSVWPWTSEWTSP